ncbi:MAG: phosphopentomutase [Firmicutes bacterium]|nr:phosphopentomutase [Bacillota bacterium]
MNTKIINRVTVIVMDSVGIGELPDAAQYNDSGSNTLANCARAVGGLELPNLARLGLGNIEEITGVPPVQKPAAAYGKMAEQSAGKDTTTGHWELAGILLCSPFPVYPNGFPPDVIKPFEQNIGREVLGNTMASGTQIIEALGKEHVKTGKPIVYTSADSVFQIAAHEDIIPLDQIYSMCLEARNILTGEHAVGRVIARPFVGQPGAFKRTANRHDYSLKPIAPTILNLLQDKGLDVAAVGKINDIFAGEGISRSVHTTGNMDGVDHTLKLMRDMNSKGLIFTNLVDFDSLYGHRNNPQGYADALQAFDHRLPEILSAVREDEILILTADHGCDPTTPSTDHSREYVPLLVYGKAVAAETNLGTRQSFTDVAATIAEIFGLSWDKGTSFASQILN